ncbi:hypothetical protein H6P81_017301 [Aristolochia fimbriata]|uniref:Methyltransferase-like protein n=1 Tax=Aristolochia fimbriata TaxID=158543 RepID=A0AAV7E233_ARIFI|nr:hypothetical protein H6P81_017301 [Aristolochia fimbriata]
MAEETQYFSKDFDFDEFREEIERDETLRCHCEPFTGSFSSLSAPSECSDAWRSFHKRHSTGRFFKERRYLLKEFPELLKDDVSSKLLEVGCGNGSTILPILRGNRSIVAYACDCSTDALERASEMIDATDESIKQRFHPFPCDFSVNGFPRWLACHSCCRNSPEIESDVFLDVVENKKSDLNNSPQGKCCIGGVDFITLIFTLSALPFQKMPFVIDECISALERGGLLFFRDYGLYDMSMLRFDPKKRLGFREYMRLQRVGARLLLHQISQSSNRETYATGLGSWKVPKALVKSFKTCS